MACWYSWKVNVLLVCFIDRLHRAGSGQSTGHTGHRPGGTATTFFYFVYLRKQEVHELKGVCVCVNHVWRHYITWQVYMGPFFWPLWNTQHLTQRSTAVTSLWRWRHRVPPAGAEDCGRKLAAFQLTSLRPFRSYETSERRFCNHAVSTNQSSSLPFTWRYIFL